MDTLLDSPKDQNLIYDVGMHKGEDSEYYLRKGFRVIGVEANAELVEICGRRLKEFVDRAQLIIVHGAVVDGATLARGQKTISFYKNEADSYWGTIRPEWAERNARLGTSSSVVEVDAVDFSDLLKRYGIPHYLKIDIEGADLICVEALSKFKERPNYISIESDKTSLANVRKEIEMFTRLGYDRFQAVEQSTLHLSQTPPDPPKEGRFAAQQFEPGSSGLFGAELSDRWKSDREILHLYRSIQVGYRLFGDDGILNSWNFRGSWRLKTLVRWLCGLATGSEVPGWYDTHARHSTAPVVE